MKWEARTIINRKKLRLASPLWSSVLMLLAGACLLEARELSVEGYGWLADMRLEDYLEELVADGRESFNASFVEEGFFLLNARLASDGYLRPDLTAQITTEDGESRTINWDSINDQTIDDKVNLSKVHFKIDPGTAYYFDKLSFQGLSAISDKEASRYFYASSSLFTFKNDRRYAPQIVRRGVNSLLDDLEARGYQDAEVSVAEQKVNHETGAADISIKVSEGKPTFLVEIEERLAEGVENEVVQSELKDRKLDQTLYNKDRVQTAAASLRRRLHDLGFPDVQVQTETVSVSEEGEEPERVRLIVTAKPGPRVRLVAVQFEGNNHTKSAFLLKKVGLQTGAWLSREDIREARNRLARLGVFTGIDTDLQGSNERTVVFTLKEGVRRELNLLAGWGSYEQLRLGAQFNWHNLWKRAHKLNTQALISLKSEEAALRYRIPAFYNFPASARANLRYLRRDEVSFERQEAFIEAGLDWQQRNWHSLYGLTYRFEVLRTRDVVSEEIEVPEQVRAGSLILRHRFDRRDAITAPKNGLLIDTEVEWAAQAFGSEVAFQLLDTQLAWHRELSETFSVHLGLRHQALFSWGSDSTDLPLNKRFFPGGENSIRGYAEGEASPLDRDGAEIGAEVVSLLNIEFATALTRRLDFVIFSDHLWQAESIEEYPGNQDLHSVGIGFRYNTPLGPVRLEYGYNLNPRSDDPSGALHFSIGYPF